MVEVAVLVRLARINLGKYKGAVLDFVAPVLAARDVAVAQRRGGAAAERAGGRVLAVGEARDLGVAAPGAGGGRAAGRGGGRRAAKEVRVLLGALADAADLLVA